MDLSLPALPDARPRPQRRPLWCLNREAACNWLALGLLLGAWNAAGDAAALRRRPAPLRAYDAVSVRAVHRARAGLDNGHNSVNGM